MFRRGDRLGDYEVIGKLRAGGMATLFLGRRHGAAGVSRPVVIKVIHPHLADDDLIVKMFIDEARISSHIAHGNVVYIEKFGEHDGVYYMVMEYVDGCSLDQVLRGMWQRKERMTPAVAAHIAIEVAAGLHAAHETCGEDGTPLHIVHRDVSPSNVLVTRSGDIKVIDFGIAKARGRLGATKSGHSLKGKIRYMSPEQAWGHEIDRRTDVYALGVVLWELLACKQLFRNDDDFRLLELVRNPTIPPVSSINRDVTAALDEVISRATARSVEHRLGSANEFRRELMRAVPDAVGVPAEELGRLVEQTRATLGLLPVEVELDATTPIGATPGNSSRAPSPDPIVIEVGSGTGSIARGNGEVQPKQSSRSRWAIAGGVVVAVVVALVVVTSGSDHDRIVPATPSSPTSSGSVATPPPSAPANLPRERVTAEPSPVPAGGSDAGSAQPVDVDPPTPRVVRPITTKPKPRPRPTSREGGAKHVRGVEVDGVLLADPNDKPPVKPTEKPSAGVDVDGTPLAP